MQCPKSYIKKDAALKKDEGGDDQPVFVFIWPNERNTFNVYAETIDAFSDCIHHLVLRKDS